VRNKTNAKATKPEPPKKNKKGSGVIKAKPKKGKNKAQKGKKK